MKTFFRSIFSGSTRAPACSSRRPRRLLSLLATLGLCAFALKSTAQVTDLTYPNLALQTSFQYQAPGTTTLATITNGFPTNASSTTGNVYLLPGTNVSVSGAMVNTLSTNAIIDIRHYDEVAMEYSFQLYNPNGGSAASGGTNVYVWGCSDDGVHFSDTNNPLFSISVKATVGQTNACVCTNVPRTLLGSHGWIQLQQIQTLNTNGCTNHSISVPGKAWRNGGQAAGGP